MASKDVCRSAVARLDEATPGHRGLARIARGTTSVRRYPFDRGPATIHGTDRHSDAYTHVGGRA